MPHMRTCCCCANVRSGSFVVVVWSLLYSSAHILVVLNDNIARIEVPGKNLYDNFTINTNNNINNDVNTRKINSVINPPGFHQEELQEIHFITLLIFSGVSLSCLLLLVGLCKDIPALLLPWIATTTLTTITELFFNLYLLFQKTKMFEPKTAIIFTFTFFFFLLQWYTVLCVYSQYKEYKAGRGYSKDNFCSFTIPGVEFEPPGKSSPVTPGLEGSGSLGCPGEKVSLTKEQENPGNTRVLSQIMEEETSFRQNSRTEPSNVENNKFSEDNDENINEDNPSSDQSISPVSPITTITTTIIDTNKENSQNEDNQDDSCDETYHFPFTNTDFQSSETPQKKETKRKVQFPSDINNYNVKVTSV